MQRITHNKLVRDKIPERIISNGDNPKFSTLNDGSYRRKLLEKLQEEVNEFIESSNGAEELADIIEVIKSICKERGIEFREIERIREKKKEEKGGFDNKILLEWIEE